MFWHYYLNSLFCYRVFIFPLNLSLYAKPPNKWSNTMDCFNYKATIQKASSWLCNKQWLKTLNHVQQMLNRDFLWETIQNLQHSIFHQHMNTIWRFENPIPIWLKIWRWSSMICSIKKLVAIFYISQ